MKKNQKYCKHCHLIHDANEVKRVYGKDSSVFIGGFCSANCFTEYVQEVKKAREIAPVKWKRASILHGELPPMSNKPNSDKCSDLLLVFCEDGEIRTGRYYKKTNTWIVTGVCGAPVNFVRYWSVNLTEEIEKMKSRMIADDKLLQESEDFCSKGSNFTDV